MWKLLIDLFMHKYNPDCQNEGVYELQLLIAWIYFSDSSPWNNISVEGWIFKDAYQISFYLNAYSNFTVFLSMFLLERFLNWLCAVDFLYGEICHHFPLIYYSLLSLKSLPILFGTEIVVQRLLYGDIPTSWWKCSFSCPVGYVGYLPACS